MNFTYQKTDPNFSARTVQACLWKNLHFLKDGFSFCGTDTYISEQRAKEGVDLQLQKDYLVTENFETPEGDVFPWSEYSHTIQIPWNK